MTLDIEMHHAFPGFALDVDFSAPAGVTALFGRSGAGKTSIVNAVAGLMRPRFGRVVLAGRTLTDTASGIWVPPHRRRIGYVFQEDRLFPHLSVAQNLAYGRGRQRDAGGVRRRRRHQAQEGPRARVRRLEEALSAGLVGIHIVDQSGEILRALAVDPVLFKRLTVLAMRGDIKQGKRVGAGQPFVCGDGGEIGSRIGKIDRQRAGGLA